MLNAIIKLFTSKPNDRKVFVKKKNLLNLAQFMFNINPLVKKIK